MSSSTSRIQDLMALARRNKDMGFYEAAGNAVRAAQEVWSDGLGIDEWPDFTNTEWHELNVDHVQALTALARRNKDKGFHEAAGHAIRAAQEVWSDGLGIEWPNFTNTEWHELNVDHIQTLTALARRNKDKGFHEAAGYAMRAAQAVWSDDLGIKWPCFTNTEWHELNVDHVQALMVLARQHKDEGFYEAAGNAMRAAQAVWSDDLGIERPDFTDTEQRDLIAGQYAQTAAQLERNIASGWRSGALAALGLAQELWHQLPEPRPPEPTIAAHIVEQLPRSTRSLQPSNLALLGSSIDSCPICLETQDAERYRHNCNNVFCKNCLDLWARYKTTCPICRGAL